MTLLKRAAAAALCAVMIAGSGLSAIAQAESAGEAGTSESLTGDGAGLIDAGQDNETTIIDAGNTTETTVIDTGDTETTIIDPEDGTAGTQEDGSGLDVTDEQYQPIDLSTYTQWDGKTKMLAGENYYISGKVSPRSDISVPAGSRLVVTEGAKLVVYKGRTMKIRGIVTVEPNAQVIASGTVSVYEKGGVENYGELKGSVSSVMKIAGDFINRSTGKSVFSGKLNIYKTGSYLNYGETTLTSNNKTKVTGDFQTAETGRLLCRGNMSVTINGRSTQSGYFSLTGELVNSGVFVFDKTVRYYKSKNARFAVSKSSRLIDFRYNDSAQVPDPDENPGDDSEEVTDIGIKGIDVSYAQGAVDWARVKESGVEFVMMRASRGALSSSRPIAEDVTFQYNVTEATKAGLNVGVYHYLYAETVAEAKKEAKFFLKTIEPYKITYPVVLDVEEQSQADLGKDKITKIAKAFLDEIRAAGYYAMLYSNKSWLTYNFDMSQLADYEIWLAQWNTVPTYKGEFGMWQYSCKGIVSGIDGYVDLNLSYKNYAKIIKKGGYNHLS